jgi:hypothetical protein
VLTDRRLRTVALTIQVVLVLLLGWLAVMSYGMVRVNLSINAGGWALSTVVVARCTRRPSTSLQSRQVDLGAE